MRITRKLTDTERAIILDHDIEDVTLTVINDGNGSLCGVTYDRRVQAGRDRDIDVFIRAVGGYMRTRLCNRDRGYSPVANAIAVRRLLAYYIEHAREIDR